MFLKNKNIIFLFLAQLISCCGDSIFNIALPWFLLEVTGSKVQTGLIATSAYLPALMLGLFAGVFIDRYDHKKIMLISDFFRFALILMVPISIKFNFFSISFIGFIVFSTSCFSTLFHPARDCFVPHIVSDKNLPNVNSLIITSGQIAQILGPIFAGIGLSFFGLIHLFTIDAMSFLISMILILLIVSPERKIRKKENISSLVGIKEGLLYVKKNSGLMVLLFITFFNNLFIMGPAYMGLVIFVRDILLEDMFVFALLETFMGLGMVLGSFFFPLFMKKIKLVNIFFIGILIDGLTFSILFFIKHYMMAVFVLFLHGIGIPLIILSRTIYIQKSIPDHFRGRVFSMVHMSVMGTTAISIAITGVLLEFIDADFLFLLIGLFASSSVIIGLKTKGFLCLEDNVN